MDRHVLTAAIVFITGFLSLYVYLTISHKERMAMIERGITPSGPLGRSMQGSNHPLQTLKWGLLVFGVGVGLVIALLLRSIPGFEIDDAIDPALMLVCGGIGLIVYYRIAAKQVQSVANNDRS